MIFTFLTFYLLPSSFLFYVHTLLCSNILTLESIFEYVRQKLKKHVHFKISYRDEVFPRLFFFFSSRDEVSSLPL